MSSYLGTNVRLGDHLDHAMEDHMEDSTATGGHGRLRDAEADAGPDPAASAGQVEEPLLDVATTRAALRSMAALTRVILGVALQAPPEEPTAVGVGPGEPLPLATTVPDSIALPPEPQHPLDVAPRRSEPDATRDATRDADWIPTVASPPRLAVVDQRPVPERQNIGLLQEIAFLDD